MLKKKTCLPSKIVTAADVAARTEYMAKLLELDTKLKALEKRIHLFQTVLDNPDMPLAEAKKILARVSNRVEQTRVKQAKVAAKIKLARKPAKRKKK